MHIVTPVSDGLAFAELNETTGRMENIDVVPWPAELLNLSDPWGMAEFSTRVMASRGFRSVRPVHLMSSKGKEITALLLERITN